MPTIKTYHLLLSIFLTIIISTNIQAQRIYNDAAGGGLLGHVKKVVSLGMTFTWDRDGSNTEISKDMIITRDDNACPIEIRYTSTNVGCKIIYDDQMRISSIHQYFDFNKAPFQTEIYLYRSNQKNPSTIVINYKDGTSAIQHITYPVIDSRGNWLERDIIQINNGHQSKIHSTRTIEYWN